MIDVPLYWRDVEIEISQCDMPPAIGRMLLLFDNNVKVPESHVSKYINKMMKLIDYQLKSQFNDPNLLCKEIHFSFNKMIAPMRLYDFFYNETEISIGNFIITKANRVEKYDKESFYFEYCASFIENFSHVVKNIIKINCTDYQYIFWIGSDVFKINSKAITDKIKKMLKNIGILRYPENLIKISVSNNAIYKSNKTRGNRKYAKKIKMKKSRCLG